MLSSLSRSVDGHVVLITGAGSGIGRATAHLFAEYGSYVAVTDIDPQRVESVVQEINASGGRSKGWELDVTDAEKVKEVVEEVSLEEVEEELEQIMEVPKKRKRSAKKKK